MNQMWLEYAKDLPGQATGSTQCRRFFINPASPAAFDAAPRLDLTGAQMLVAHASTAASQIGLSGICADRDKAQLPSGRSAARPSADYPEGGPPRCTLNCGSVRLTLFASQLTVRPQSGHENAFAAASDLRCRLIGLATASSVPTASAAAVGEFAPPASLTTGAQQQLCQCGRAFAQHHSLGPGLAVGSMAAAGRRAAGAAWRPETHTISSPTDAYGVIEFASGAAPHYGQHRPRQRRLQAGGRGHREEARAREN
uniref:Uncharacterized protein n=1 Tax=Macrostomum lignano TaxID=282301 RepID=A0A1I8FGR5_9PLAT